MVTSILRATVTSSLARSSSSSSFFKLTVELAYPPLEFATTSSSMRSPDTSPFMMLLLMPSEFLSRLQSSPT